MAKSVVFEEGDNKMIVTKIGLYKLCYSLVLNKLLDFQKKKNCWKLGYILENFKGLYLMVSKLHVKIILVSMQWI